MLLRLEAGEHTGCVSGTVLLECGYHLRKKSGLTPKHVRDMLSNLVNIRGINCVSVSNPSVAVRLSA